MMKMVSLKSDDAGMSPTEMTYGYGTRICLNDDQCEALGFKQPPKAGTVVMVQALATIVRSTGSVEMDGDDTGNDVSMELQLTDMSISPARAAKSAASSLYGGEGED